MIRAVIIDDEKNSQDIIRLILKRYRPEVEILGCGDSTSSGISLIREIHPNLVFLDLEMADGTGFDVLDGLDALDFEVVFITAHEKRFLHAIRFSEMEVILKPVDKDGLCEAVRKAGERITKKTEKERYQILLENIREGNTYRIVLPTSEGLKTLSILDISQVEQMDDQSLFHLISQSAVLSQRPFRYYWELFGPLQFFQVNNGKMINLRYLKKPVSGNSLQLTDGTRIEITNKKKLELMDFLKGS